VFLLVAHFLDAQNLVTAAYMAVAALGLVAGLIATQTRNAELAGAASRNLKLAGQLLVQALPLAILLFLLFPRIHGPLWGLPQQAAAKSGLSDRMSPGDISQLIQSDELAFRAEFPGARPDSNRLYWRGPVLWDYDGRAWRTVRPIEPTAPNAAGIGSPVRYTLTLEPHRQRWLFLLGLPTRLPGIPSSLGPDLQWLAKDPVTERLRYEIDAHLDYRLDPELTGDARARALDLPSGINPRARGLAEIWRGAGTGDVAIVEQALTLFRQQAFFYTLNPPLLGEAAVDDFLFTTRRGFCEHYASAFTFLMRAAGVPARVVTGYQGGEFNPYGNYWMVRGRDAHAWAEVWLAGRGWTRVDPTAAVAPSRVESGVDAALPAAERPAGLVTLEGAWLRPLRLGWDLLNNRWNQWVLGYNQDRQRQFLAGLNPMLATLRGMISLLVIMATATLLLLSLRLLGQRRSRGDRTVRAYARFCARLGRLGLPRAPAEGAEAFGRRAAQARPDLAEEIDRITRLYVDLRYGMADPAATRPLEAAVRGFRPARRPP
jgi:transglutaminase-like putative cysteine protease